MVELCCVPTRHPAWLALDPLCAKSATTTARRCGVDHDPDFGDARRRGAVGRCPRSQCRPPNRSPSCTRLRCDPRTPRPGEPRTSSAPEPVVVATTNVTHLSRYTPRRRLLAEPMPIPHRGGIGQLPHPLPMARHLHRHPVGVVTVTPSPGKPDTAPPPGAATQLPA